MKEKDTPLPLVRMWERMIPGVYSQMDMMHGAKAEGEIQWPDYCELPIGAAFTFLVYQEKLSAQQAAALAAELTACWMWRRSKIVYAFEQALADSLAAQAEDVKDTDVLPCDLLLHLPYPCVYIKAKILEDTDGFFVWVEYDINRKEPELRIQWVVEGMKHSVPQVLHLIPNATIKDCVMDTIKTSEENLELDIKIQDAGVEIARTILSAIQLVLYLLARNADIEEVKPPLVKKSQTKNVVTVSTQKAKDDKAGQVKEYGVGIRVGAALRKAYSPKEAQGRGGDTHVSTPKRSHTRRGHWHHYWTGPLNGDRTLVLKWTPPTIIHPESREDNIVIYPAKM